MVPFKFCGLWVGHDSTFEIDVVSFLNISETRKHSSKKICFIYLDFWWVQCPAKGESQPWFVWKDGRCLEERLDSWLTHDEDVPVVLNGAAGNVLVEGATRESPLVIIFA